MSKPNKVEEILIQRDGMSQEEARALRLECAEALENGDEEALSYYLNLEDDYIFDVMGW